MTDPGTLTAGQRDWLRVRSYLAEQRHELTLAAAEDFPAGSTITGTALLTTGAWQPAEPVPLQDIALELSIAPLPAPLAPAGGDSDEGEGTTPTLPSRADGTPYLRYSEALLELAPPALFENRPTYRLTEATLASAAPRLAFTRGRYFDGIDTGEAAAHEYAATRLDAPTADASKAVPAAKAVQAAGPAAAKPVTAPAGLRAAIGDPRDLTRRPANLAVSTLTLRLDRVSGRASFLMHWRNPAKVGHAGGMYQVIPVGVFQPSGEAAWNERPDFSLWHNMIREFAEELAGRSEDYDSETSPIDYDAWPFARQMTQARDRGQIRIWCLGLGVDPLTFATDLLTVAVIDSTVFDELFSLSPRGNEEGQVLAAREFAAYVIDRVLTRDPVQAAGAALLRLAWAHRDTLLG